MANVGFDTVLERLQGAKVNPDDELDIVLARLLREFSIIDLLLGSEHVVYDKDNEVIARIVRAPITITQVNELSKMLYKLQKYEHDLQKKSMRKK